MQQTGKTGARRSASVFETLAIGDASIKISLMRGKSVFWDHCIALAEQSFCSSPNTSLRTVDRTIGLTFNENL